MIEFSIDDEEFLNMSFSSRFSVTRIWTWTMTDSKCLFTKTVEGYYLVFYSASCFYIVSLTSLSRNIYSNSEKI
jgi:hypothetical protein